MINREVTCINKRQHYNPHERILAIGGLWGKISQTEMPLSKLMLKLTIIMFTLAYIVQR